jgi:hypothetical protein
MRQEVNAVQTFLNEVINQESVNGADLRGF